MSQPTIGLLQPGEMGAAVGACLTHRGLLLLGASADRRPASTPGDSRLYLSGQQAGKISETFAGTALDATVMGGEPSGLGGQDGLCGMRQGRGRMLAW